MKKRILGVVFGAALVFGSFGLSTQNVDAQEEIISGGGFGKSGKWVPFYGGGSNPQSCRCVESLTVDDCFVSDTTSDTTRCD